MQTKRTSNFGQKMSCLGILQLRFEKTIAIFEINTLQLVKLQGFVKKWKISNLATKMPYLGV